MTEELRAAAEALGENVVIGSTQWMRADGSRQVRFQVLTLRGCKITTFDAIGGRSRTCDQPTSGQVGRSSSCGD
jgi:hypothetical protein